MAFWDELIVAGRSRRQIPDAPCSRSARAQTRASVPAPPVRTTLPWMANRPCARAEGVGDVMRGSGAVSGLMAVDNVI